MTVLAEASEADGDRTTKVLFTAGESHSMLSLAVLPTAIVITYQQSIRKSKNYALENTNYTLLHSDLFRCQLFHNHVC